MPRRGYSAETKAAVMAALLEGQGATKVAAQYGLPEGTVKGWRNRMSGTTTMHEVVSEKGEEIGELLVKYLRTNLVTLQEQSLLFRDAEWLRQQSASDVAVLHGVLTDKSIRLLEALGGVGDPAPHADPTA